MNHIIAAFCFGCLFVGQLPPPWDAEAEALKGLDGKDVQMRRDSAMYFSFMYRKVPQDFSPRKEVMSALLKALDDPDSEVRYIVVHTFSRFGEASKPAVPLLARLMRNDKEATVRSSAAGALLELGPVSKEALPALIEAAKDKDKLVRIYAGTAVVGLREGDEKTLRFLLEFSTDEDEVVQREASSAFVYIGVRAIPIFRDGLKDKNCVVRSWTIGAFIAVLTKNVERAKFPADAIPLLINAINDENTSVARSAIYAVSRLGFEGKDAIPTIVKRFKDPDWQVRQYAIMHVEEFGPAAELAIPALKDALKDDHERVRVAAERALAAIEKAKKGPVPYSRLCVSMLRLGITCQLGPPAKTSGQSAPDFRLLAAEFG